MSDLSFFVPGKAAPQGSKRHVGKGRLVEMSKDLPAWRKAVTAAAKASYMGGEPIDGPVSVALTVYVEKPRSTKFRAYPAGSPDLDKYQRSVGDALEKAGVLTNDARIVHWDPWKRWATEANPPGAHITIVALGDQR